MPFNTNVNPQYALYAWQWKRNKDCVRDLVKQAMQEYLPDNTLPTSALSNAENAKLNEYIKHRYNTITWKVLATFFNFTRPTLGAWAGLIMAKKPTISFTDEKDAETDLDYLMDNADGDGNGLIELSKAAIDAAIETGGGLFIVVPPSESGSLWDLRTGEIAPRIKVYDRSNILDWNTVYRNSKKQLNYLKLREFETVSDGVTNEVIEKHIEYWLRDGVVSYEVSYNMKPKTGAEHNGLDYQGELIKNGKLADEIPACWFGAANNDSEVDPAPITSIAELNLLHYVMYTRHNQQCYDAGQGQYHIDLGTMDNLNATDAKGNPISPIEKLNPGGVKLGSMAPIVTANGGKAELLQLSTDSLLGEEPGKIEERALKIGAQMITDADYNTATSARISFGATTSNLVTISCNVSMAMKQTLLLLAEYVGYNKPEQIKFELSKKLITETLTAQDKQAFMQMVMNGVYSLKALFVVMQRAGDIPTEWTYEDFTADIQESQGFIANLGMGTAVPQDLNNG